MKVNIFTDGACSGNPGPGGWGALLVAKKNGKVISEKKIYGGEKNTTNNRMELMAAIMALESLKRPVVATVFTDSVYVKDGITKWIKAWKYQDWRTASRKPVKNVDLWQRLDAAVAGHDVNWRWVKGHAGHLENERVDNLARASAEEIRDNG